MTGSATSPRSESIDEAAAPVAAEDWLRPIGTSDPHWLKRLDVRLAFLLSLVTIAAGLALPPLRQWIRSTMAAAPGETPPATAVVSLIEWVFVSLLLAGAAFLTIRLVQVFITQRIRDMVLVLARPIERDAGAPYPVVADAPDEIGQLAAAMNVMHARIRDLVRSVEDRDRRRRQWLSRISHDLRTPLTALNACLTRARMNAEALPEGDGKTQFVETLTVAQLDADRFQALAADLLDVARLEEEDVKIVREPVPPVELVRRVVRSLQVLAEDLDIRVVVDAAHDAPELIADGHRLARALENLLRNALHHGEREVVVSVQASGDGVTFAVADDGPGLPTGDDGEVDLDLLANLPGRRDSTGIGLLVARRVATAHQGTIGGANREGGGALFWLRVPAPSDASSQR